MTVFPTFRSARFWRRMGRVMGVVQLDSPAADGRLRLAGGDWIVRWAEVEAKEGEKGFFVEATA